jgi:uncharacterized protein (TIGR01777 family)
MKKNVLITGGTGLLGQRLISYLGVDNYNFRILSRGQEGLRGGIQYYKWSPSEMKMDVEALNNVDIIINLAGASIAGARWTEERKKLIINSRLNSIKTLALHLPKLKKQAQLIIGASAIGYYGNRGNQILTEEAEPGAGFLSEVCQLWEKEYETLYGFFERHVILRIGIVLSTKGGALKEMLKPSQFGVFGYFGSGDAIYSWIHIDDICEFIRQSIEKDSYRGVFNTVAENPVSNKSIVSAMKKAKAHFGITAPVPEFMLKLILGEMSTVLTNSSHAIPKNASQLHHQFLFSDHEKAIGALLESGN